MQIKSCFLIYHSLCNTHDRKSSPWTIVACCETHSDNFTMTFLCPLCWQSHLFLSYSADSFSATSRMNTLQKPFLFPIPAEVGHNHAVTCAMVCVLVKTMPPCNTEGKSSGGIWPMPIMELEAHRAPLPTWVSRPLRSALLSHCI